MAHFAEIDNNNTVLRVVVIDNNDVNANGGDQSAGAEEAVKNIVPFTTGNRWVQTSYNNNFRKQYAGIGYSFD
jgi:phosphotransferase system IIB component